MKGTARLFNCTRCGRQVRICRLCDRGNIYCGSKCSRQARSFSLQAAGKRYQNTRQGKLNHAARQKRYRDKNKFVTHHTSNDPSPYSSIGEVDRTAEFKSELRCDFCNKPCLDFVRLDFLQKYSPRLTNALFNWPSGP